MGQKRRRIALSCVDCRRRKVKCDRSYPSCLRCKQGGHADSCAYVPYQGAEPTEGPQSNDDDTGDQREMTGVSSCEDLAENARSENVKDSNSSAPRAYTVPPAFRKSTEKSDTIRRLEQKVLDLEARVEAANSREAARTSMYAQHVLGLGIPTPASSITPENDTAAAVELEQSLLRGKSFKTQYYGPSNSCSMLLQFSELSFFIKDIMKYMPPKSRLKSATDGPCKKNRQTEALIQARPPHEHNALLDLIPDRETADRLVQSYINNIEVTYRVLHVPSFLQSYESFWQNPREAPSDFLVILLLVMATMYCVYPSEPTGFVGRSSERREQTIRWIAACDSWMDTQSQKHVTIASNQVQILLFLAKRVNCIKLKRAWTTTGQLLRRAMAAGLHREPTFLSSKISVFHQEMRRRLWATVLELELLTAIDRGMPGSITALDWDCQPPSNIHDEDLDENMQTLPPSKPYHEFTRTSFLCVALQTTAYRLEMLSTVNRVKSTLTLGIASNYDIKIRQAYATIPTWSFEPDSRLPRTLARLNLLEFINLIHQPFLTSTEDPARHFFSRAASRDAATTILELYRDLAEIEQLTLSCYRSDSYRAVLCLCYDLSVNSSAGPTTMFDRPHATELLEHALSIQDDLVMRLGQGLRSYWITSCALGLVYSKQSPSEDPAKYAQQAADRVVKVNERVVALQQPHLDGQARRALEEEQLIGAQAKSDDMPGGGEPEPVLARMEPFADTPLDFESFNLAEIWDLASFGDFSWV
jgi:Fungal specific transcription factor domain/Fungal Zn(2)-Cys(6) binuclear cluster domain